MSLLLMSTHKSLELTLFRLPRQKGQDWDRMFLQFSIKHIISDIFQIWSRKSEILMSIYKKVNNANRSWGYQSWKQLLHIECPQLGNTILVQFSMHIPHSASLSRSLSENFLVSSTLFLAKISADWLLEVLSSNSINSPSSCLREGYITAARNFTIKHF